MTRLSDEERRVYLPLVVRDTARCREMVRGLFDRGILAVGLTFPVVPRGDETIRFQINAAHTQADIDEVLAALESLKNQQQPLRSSLT